MGPVNDTMGHLVNFYQFGITSGKETKNFNGEAALIFRACFHIEGDWRPFEYGILWGNEGATSPVEIKDHNNTILHIMQYYIK